MPENTIKSITRQKFIEKYGDVKVKFLTYYKYTFTYTGTLPDGGTISIGFGGNADDIYRCDVIPDKEETVRFIYPYRGKVCDKNGLVIDEFYDYDQQFQTVTLASKQWQVLSKALDTAYDEGPPGHGWKSKELSSAIAALENEINPNEPPEQ